MYVMYFTDQKPIFEDVKAVFQ